MNEQTARRSHQFDAIHIIQCLNPLDELRTGEELYRYLIPHCDSAQVRVELSDEATASGIIETLEKIADDCVSTGSSPVIHLETHATKMGFGPSSDDLLPWDALVSPLTRINQISHMNLLVTMAACHGFNLVSTLKPSQPSPVWGLLGPDEQVMPSDIRRGFQAFYQALLQELSLNGAIEALKAHDESWPDTWRFQNAEFFFANVFGEVVKRQLEPEEQARYERDALAEAKRRGIPVTPMVRRKVRASARDFHGAFRDLRRTFLMLDRFPENEARFPMSLDEVLDLKGIVL